MYQIMLFIIDRAACS